MNLLLLTLLLQSSMLLPPRTAVENPKAVSPVPIKLQKDYDKLWTRFVTAKDDAKLLKDLDKLLKKQKTLDAAWTIQGYVSLYKGDKATAWDKFQQALSVNPKNRIAISYLAELAYSQGEYARSAALYAQLQAIDPNYPEIETKRQKAFLLATDDLLRGAARAESVSRFAEAEEFYRRALQLAPNDPVLLTRLADTLLKQNKNEEAESIRKSTASLMPASSTRVGSADTGQQDELEDLGRWGHEIETLHQIRDADAITKEQFAILTVRYFPQVTEFIQAPRVIIDIQDSPARSEIQALVGIGLMEPRPNHAIEPSSALSRGELAMALARLGRLLRVTPSSGQPAQLSPPDVTASHALYAEIQQVLDSGVMTLDSGKFNVTGRVSGRQAVESVDRLMRIFQQGQR
jgi:tetratricopeptide (TPR) repeat protein